MIFLGVYLNQELTYYIIYAQYYLKSKFNNIWVNRNLPSVFTFALNSISGSIESVVCNA